MLQLQFWGGAWDGGVISIEAQYNEEGELELLEHFWVRKRLYGNPLEGYYLAVDPKLITTEQKEARDAIYQIEGVVRGKGGVAARYRWGFMELPQY